MNKESFEAIVRELKQQYPWPTAKPAVAANPHGWMDASNRELLGKHITKETKFIVELGTWFGMSARWMLDQAHPESVCVCVDWWEGDQFINRSARIQPWLPTLYETFLSTNWNYRERMIPMREISPSGLRLIHEACERHPGAFPEVFFVDANHAYTAVKEDIRMIRDWFPGVPMVGDDYNNLKDFPGVQKAVHEAKEKYSLQMETKAKTWRLWQG
jgi:hypothetical protein